MFNESKPCDGAANAQAAPMLYLPGCEPDGIPLNTPTRLTCTVVTAAFSSPPKELMLNRLGPVQRWSAALRDDGRDAGVITRGAEDPVFTRGFRIRQRAVPDEGRRNEGVI